jgi:hypothetical protein
MLSRFVILFFSKFYYSDQITGYKMGVACNTQ